MRVPESIQYKVAVLSYKVSITIPRRDRPTWDHSLVSLTYLVDEHSALPAPIARNLAGSTLFQTSHHLRPSFFGCRLTDLELTTRQSFRHQHCGRSSTNWKLFFISTILYSLALNSGLAVTFVTLVTLIIFWCLRAGVGYCCSELSPFGGAWWLVCS